MRAVLLRFAVASATRNSHFSRPPNIDFGMTGDNVSSIGGACEHAGARRKLVMTQYGTAKFSIIALLKDNLQH